MVTQMALVREDGYVENVIMYDSDSDYTPPDGLQMVEAPDGVAPGYWYVSGSFVSGELQVSVNPNPVTVGEMVNIVGMLPPNSPDTELTFQVQDGQTYAEPVIDRKASHIYAFVDPGVYRVKVSAPSHSPRTVRVIVSD